MKSKVFILIVLSILVFGRFLAYPARAELITSQNDNDSSINKVKTEDFRIIEINSLKIKNNIFINADTGSNEASDNDGETVVTTGDVNIKIETVNILNESDSSEQRDQDEVSAGDEVIIYEEEAEVINTAEVSNVISIDSSSGENKSSNNSGNVSILTGDIYLEIILSNKANTGKIEANSLEELLYPSNL